MVTGKQTIPIVKTVPRAKPKGSFFVFQGHFRGLWRGKVVSLHLINLLRFFRMTNIKLCGPSSLRNTAKSALLHNMIPFSIGEKSCLISYFSPVIICRPRSQTSVNKYHFLCEHKVEHHSTRNTQQLSNQVEPDARKSHNDVKHYKVYQ